jgi:hypothetical protein
MLLSGKPGNGTALPIQYDFVVSFFTLALALA